MGCPVRVLDSSFLIALFIEDDPHHVKAMRDGEAGARAGESWMVPDPILFETLTVIRYEQGASAAKTAFNQLMSNRNIQIYTFSARERLEILEMFLASSYSISSADASVAFLCRRLGSPAFAYDENLLKVLANQTLKD